MVLWYIGTIYGLANMSNNNKMAPGIPGLSDNTKGILWMLIATFLFAVVAAMAKVIVHEVHVLQILLFRQIFVFASTVPAIAKSPTQIFVTRHPWMHAARLLGAFVALACGIWAVSVLPLTAAITLGFAQVFFVALLAKAFLGEHVGLRRMMAVMVGFIGVIIVMRPGADEIINFSALIPIVGALGAGVAVIAVRRLSQTETTASLLVYQAIFVGLLAAIPLIWYWKNPSQFELLMLIAMGILSAAGQWAGVKSLRLGEASVVGNIEYMKLIHAAILGFILFSEIPDIYTITGAATIVGSSLYMFRREAKLTP